MATPATNDSGLQAFDTFCLNVVSNLVTKGGRLWENWSQIYETDICLNGGDFCGKIWSSLQTPVTTLLRIAPIAIAILVITNPIALTGSFVKAVAVAFALSTTPDLFSKEGKVKLCQGAALATGTLTFFTILKTMVTSLTIFSAAAIVGGIALTGAFYYAGRHFQS